MNSDEHSIPPEHIWIPVWDLTSAMNGLALLLKYILEYDKTLQRGQDSDAV